MADEATFSCAGHRWTVVPMGVDEQFEAECILAKLFLGPLAGGIREVVDGLASTLVELLREQVGEAGEFDLERALSIDTADARLGVSWRRLLDALSTTAGDVIRTTATLLVDRLEYRDLVRLCQLTLLGKKACAHVGAQTIWVSDFGTLSSLLRHPSDKWELLGKALMVTYAHRNDGGGDA